MITSIVNLVGVLAAYIPMRLIGRKSIFVMGYGGMSLLLLMIGLSYLKEWNMTMFISVCIYIFIFQLTVGGCTWFYTAEVTLDKSMGVCMFI